MVIEFCAPGMHLVMHKGQDKVSGHHNSNQSTVTWGQAMLQCPAKSAVDISWVWQKRLRLIKSLGTRHTTRK